jgi:hypothetical protein
VQQVADRGGRGGRAGPQSGGRGQGAGGRGGGDRAVGRGAGISGAGRNTNPPRLTAVQSAQSSQSAAPAAVPDQSDSPTPAAVPVASSAPTAPTTSTGSSGWGSGGKTLAEKLKQAEIQKLAPPAQPEISNLDRSGVSLYAYSNISSISAFHTDTVC